MARPHRSDPPGTWHHVMNRGIDRRPIFRSRAEKRFFLSLVARTVRRGGLEVHAFCVMDNHFHLLIRSPRGGLSDAMHWIQNTYARRFNRFEDRDGSLYRARFTSRAVHDESYRCNVVRYVDANPVSAGMCARPQDWEASSAARFVSGQVPLWLTSDYVLASVDPHVVEKHGMAAAYARAWGGGEEAVTELVERRLELPDYAVDRLGFLQSAPRRDVARWLAALRPARVERMAVVARPTDVRRAVEAVEASGLCGTLSASGGRCRDPWRVMVAGLLFVLCRLRYAAIGRELGRSMAAARRSVQQFFDEAGDGGAWCVAGAVVIAKVAQRSQARM